MSLRWKLLRFQTAKRVLDAPPPAGADEPSAILPPASRPAPPSPDDALLARFARASDAATASDADRGVVALAKPRGVLDVFRLPGAVSGRPAALTGVAHDSLVAAVRVVPALTDVYVVSVGLDAKALSVKVWAFAQLHGADASPGPGRLVDEEALASRADSVASGFSPSVDALICGSTLRTQSDAQPSALAVLSGSDPRTPIQTIAVGFEDASVVLFSGDLLRERFTRIRVGPAAGELRDVRPVTFLAFCEDHLLCVTEQSVAALHPVYEDVPNVSRRGASTNGPLLPPLPAPPKRYEREAFDTRGALEGHSVARLRRSNEIVIAREEALYFFNKDGRTHCFAFPSGSANTYIAAAGPYVIHATPNAVVVYDVVTKVVAYRGNGSVRAAYSDESTRSTMLVMNDLSLIRLEEVRLESRIHMLLSRAMYEQAIMMAKEEGPANPDAPSALFTGAVCQHAQVLISKGDYDEAAAQLITTIGGAVEPSWVITRLVEQPGLRSGLRSYLEALHYAGHASFVHTRVLITCYRHDRARASILHTAAASAAGSAHFEASGEDRTTDDHIIKVLSDVKWTEDDVDTAIDICCDAGLYGVAENVARKRGRNVRLARTLVENLDDIHGGLHLLRGLSNQTEALHVAAVCGRKLLARAPREFVAIATDLLVRPVGETSGTSRPLLKDDGQNGSSDLNAHVTEMAKLFVDRPRWLATLLEGVVSRTSGLNASQDTSIVWALLFESLTRVDVDRPEGAPTGRSALKILQSRTAKVDLQTALAVSERHGHGPCLEYVYEHMRMYRELAQLLRMSNDVPGMLRACRRHGKQEPHLWLEAIRLFAPLAGQATSSEGQKAIKSNAPAADSQTSTGARQDSTGSGTRALTDAKEGLQEAMSALDSSGLLSSVEIIEAVCSACPSAKWSLVHDYFEQTVVKLAARAEDDEAAAESMSREAVDVRAESARLQEAVIVKPRLCGVCDETLTFPSVHFFCNHSFHAACVTPSGTTVPAESESSTGSGFGGLFGGFGNDHEEIDGAAWAEIECPACAPELDAMVSMRHALEEKNVRHDDFFRRLRSTKSDAGYDVIIEFLDRSPFL